MTSHTERHLSAESFAGYVASAAPIEHPIPGDPLLILFVDPQRVRIGIRGPAGANETPPPINRERLTVAVVHHDGHRMIEIAVTDHRLFADAYPILCAVADRAQLDGLSMTDALAETLRRLGHLLEPEDALPHGIEVGLLGELSLLAGLAHTADQVSALAAWRGAAAEEHDFDLSGINVEVKTTASEVRAHRISSLTQLAPTSERPLWLVSFQVTAAGAGGTSLAQLVTRVRGLFAEGATRTTFDSKLHDAGWRDRHANLALRSWRLRNPVAAYAVTSMFPRLTPDLLETASVSLAHITDVKYRVDLTGLAHWQRADATCRGLHPCTEGARMSDSLATAYSAAIDAMRRTGPKRLHDLAAMISDDATATAGDALLAHLKGAGPDDALRQAFAHALAGWDFTEGDAAWMQATQRNTVARRQAVLAALGMEAPAADLLNELFPIASADTPIVIADDWVEWRTPERRSERDFYWAHYERYLLDKGWDPGAVAQVDNATEEVIRRLSDPTRGVAYQAKGLVVGYVQSGKTANFTGVAAKAVDAGYRLIVVLTGTTNMLRAQTQRRMDMELCGRENLEREISAYDQKGHDYDTDPDWIADRFLHHGGRPSDTGHTDIHRLSTHRWDYRRLRQGVAALEFERRERNRRFYDPINLFTSNARLVVAKKNSSVLRALVADLGRITDRLGEVPVLIIDDESDQASVNTISPKKWAEGRRERTAINRLISDLLRMMPRAQYVGYTATPYANVFIDPSDVEDIFPRDFLVSLPRPAGYMGPEDFHDFGTCQPA